MKRDANHIFAWVVIVTLTSVLLAVSGEPFAEDTAIYEKLADGIVWTPDASFAPRSATLRSGEISCPSIRAVGITMACAAHLTTTNNATEAGIEQCKQVRKNLGCYETEENEFLTVATVYTMTIPEQAPRPRALAKVRGENGDDRYVFYEALSF